MKIEVETSTLSFTGSNVWTWNQVRPNDPCSHLCFVAIYPDKVRVFNVPKDNIPKDVLWPQHGIGGDGGTTTQIKWAQRGCNLTRSSDGRVPNMALNAMVGRGRPPTARRPGVRPRKSDLYRPYPVGDSDGAAGTCRQGAAE